MSKKTSKVIDGVDGASEEQLAALANNEVPENVDIKDPDEISPETNSVDANADTVALSVLNAKIDDLVAALNALKNEVDNMKGIMPASADSAIRAENAALIGSIGVLQGRFEKLLDVLAIKIDI